MQKSVTKPGVVILFVSSCVFFLPAGAMAGKKCKGLELKTQLIAVSDPKITGTATVCEDDEGVRGEVRAQNLTPGFAYSAWWIYIDKPDLCETPRMCGPGPNDFLGPNPLGVFGRMDSVTADESGEVMFSGSVRGGRLSANSQVWYDVNVHGPADTEDNLQWWRQAMTPQEPVFGAPAAGAEADGRRGMPAFFAIFDVPKT